MNVFTDNLKKIFQYFGSKIFAKKIPVENKDVYNASQKTDRFRKGNFSIVSNRVDDFGILKRRGAENVKSGEVAKAKIIGHPIKKRRASIVENENKIRETNILSNNLQNEYEDKSVLAEVVNSGVNIVMKDNKKGIVFFGSGVILNENGFIITNDHVVPGY